ncbi:hypothetical protein M3Y99_00172000 [Aphelenchoides fujianensis]|nr:hypothetical protein M3Y99_00172000 [Aphelenchoides fujianensis]
MANPNDPFSRPNLWADLYCHPTLPFDHSAFICGQQNERYDLEASSTGTLLNGEFMARYPDRRPISARYVADQLKIVGLDGHDFISPNVSFISAFSADIRFFESAPLVRRRSVRASRPMDGALIRQWYEQKLIRKPLLSLAAFYSRGVLGHVDPQRCDLRTLVYHPLTSPKYWVIEADSFAITGFREFGRTLLSSVPDVPGSGMPQHVADFFFQQGLFMIEYDILFVRCNASIEVMFRLGDHHYNWNLV